MALDLTLSLADRKSSQGESDIMDMDLEAPQKTAGQPAAADEVTDDARMGLVGELFESSCMYQACHESLQAVFSRMQSAVNTANAPVADSRVATDGSTSTTAATARPFLVPYEGK